MGLSKKIMAGLAAAATLLAGLAVGATAANAEDAAPVAGPPTGIVTGLGDGTITLKSEKKENFTLADGTTPRTFRYVKLADYKLVPETVNDGESQYLTLVTNPTYKGAIETAINKTFTLSAGATISGDPLVWAATKTIDEATWRTFMGNLETELKNQNLAISTTIQPQVTEDADGASAKFDFSNIDGAGPGLYMLSDTTESGFPTVTANGCTTTYGKLSDMLIGTRIEGANVTNADGTLQINGKPTNVGAGVGDTKTNITINCTGEFQFQKIGVGGDSDGLDGVTFTMKKLAADATAPATKDAYDEAFNNAKDKGTLLTSTSVNDVKGLVKTGDVTPGIYLIKETMTASGYLTDDAYYARLVLTVTQTATGLDCVLTAVDDHGLFTPAADGALAKYKNVQNTTQLPKTGAEGIALFAVVAVLLAGGAGVTFVRSRTVKRSLR